MKNTRYMYHKIIVIPLLLILFSSCLDEVGQKLVNKPRSLGLSNEIVVVSDQSLWESPVGDTVTYYFESSYPVMPSPEPNFDLRHFTVEDLNAEPLRKQLRTYLIVANLNDKSSPTTKMVRADMGEERYLAALNDNTKFSTVAKNKWANGQLLIYIFAATDDQLMANISKAYPAVAGRVRMHDEDQIRASAYVRGNSQSMKNRIIGDFNIDMDIPVDFQVAAQTENKDLLWLRKDIDDGALNIVIQKIAYESQDQFSGGYIKEQINDFGKRFVSSDSEGSYLVINDEDLPTFEYDIEINKAQVKEMRGIWEMVNDFMGGPFAAYLVHNEADESLVLINAFIFRPGKDKRDLMQQLESIVKTVKPVKQKSQ